ncbi:glycosyltransferase [Nibribacter ruber]|uniref:Glycosyltransferase n=1 Tax=Nibribacter ruber TaxID=2698458 RepID=A0A6P1NU25_9BACT|nr:glycosyltransferase [Nibribacter ruber]QHL86550.1 glycosyltransferase [Nibribacter ruber]
MKVEIAVVIPCLNNLKGLQTSIASVQSRHATAVVVIDDGSKPPFQEAQLTLFLKENIALYLLTNEQNLGIERSLNKGLQFAKEELGCTYIARLDAGDTCHPDRLSIQADFLAQHPDVYLVGSWVDMVDLQQQPLFTFTAPAQHEKIASQMYINNCFLHPSVMFKTAAIDKIGYYSLNYPAAEDYEYFFRFVKTFKVAILEQVLLVCEHHPKGISMTKRKVQIKSRNKVILHYFNYSLPAFIGLVKNCVFLMLPYSWITWAKKKLY